MRKGVVLCSGCVNLDLDKIASKIGDAEVVFANGCEVDVDYDFVVFGCAAHAFGYNGNYEVVDLRLIESIFENPEDVAAAWIKSSLVFSEPDIEAVETGYDVIYEGDNVEVVSELMLSANVTVVTTNPETIKRLYPKVRVVKGKIEEIKGSAGNFEVVVNGIDLATRKEGRIVLHAGQVITSNAEEREGVFTGNEYRAALKALNNLGSFTRIKAVEVNHDVCGTSKSGISGCSLCLACPTNSIERRNGKLYVKLDTCVGCGFCSAICPISAIRNNVLPSEVLLEKIDAVLSSEGIVAFVCQNSLGEFYEMFENGEKENGEKLPAILPVVVPCIYSVSEVHYLYAVLKGAKGVVAVPCDCENARYDGAFNLAKATLEAFGFDGLRIAKPHELKSLKFGEVPGKLIDSVEGDSKRQKWLYMVERLMVFPLRKSTFQTEQFGKIEVGDSCTFCRACTSFCPSGAIVRDENGKLLFTHALCFACNLCVQVCPENAINLENVLDFNSLAEKVVFEDEIIKCPSCGKPHISRKAYEKIKALSGMDTSLLFCPDCRPKIIFEALYDEIMEERRRRTE